MKSPHTEIESSMKILNIPKLQFPVDSIKETKSPNWQEHIQETFCRPLPSPNQKINLHQMHVDSTQFFPSSKHYNNTPRDKFTTYQFGTLIISHLDYKFKAYATLACKKCSKMIMFYRQMSITSSPLNLFKATYID